MAVFKLFRHFKADKLVKAVLISQKDNLGSDKGFVCLETPHYFAYTGQLLKLM